MLGSIRNQGLYFSVPFAKDMFSMMAIRTWCYCESFLSLDKCWKWGVIELYRLRFVVVKILDPQSTSLLGSFGPYTNPRSEYWELALSATDVLAWILLRNYWRIVTLGDCYHLDDRWRYCWIEVHSSILFCWNKPLINIFLLIYNIPFLNHTIYKSNGNKLNMVRSLILTKSASSD